jgi:hypothetical protein
MTVTHCSLPILGEEGRVWVHSHLEEADPEQPVWAKRKQLVGCQLSMDSRKRLDGPSADTQDLSWGTSAQCQAHIGSMQFRCTEMPWFCIKAPQMTMWKEGESNTVHDMPL